MNPRSKRIAVATAICAFAPTISQSHVLWINVVPQAEEHVIVSLAYGDFLPHSELMATDWGAMTVKSYELVTPAGERSSLEPPVVKTQPKKSATGNVTIEGTGDTGIRKVSFSPQTTKGTYQAIAQTPVFQYTKYRDRAGAEHYSDEPPEKLPDAVKILDRSFEVMFMKATFSVGGWSEPQPVGQLFEIVPLTDLSEAKVGDVVRFKVLFDGRAWVPQGISPQLTAHNSAFGDTSGVYVPLAFGEGSFRLTHAGLWKINARFRASVGNDERYGRLAPTAPKEAPIFFETTFVMNIRS